MTVFRTFLTNFVLSTCLFYRVNGKCDSFGSVNMHVVSKNGAPYNTSVEGCIQRLTFDEGRILVTEVYAYQQQVEHLKKDAVKHLVNLRVASFVDCDIETIESGAFRNVPRLAIVTLTKNRLKAIPVDVFNIESELEIVHLQNNEIEYMDDLAFAGISTLKNVNISYNRLQEFKKTWFLNCVYLTKLDLSHNRIKIIPNGAFENLSNLTEIYLDYNALNVIHSHAFRGIRRLSVLNLRNNFLSVLNPSTFPSNFQVSKFSIDANRFNYLGSELLAKLRVKEIWLNGNPWKCHCWDRINYWVYQNNGTVMSLDECTIFSIPSCIYPKVFSDTCLDVVDDEVTETFLDRVRTNVGNLENLKSIGCVSFEEK